MFVLHCCHAFHSAAVATLFTRTCLRVCLFVYLCLRPTHRLFMGRTRTATRTDAITHPWGPEPLTHSQSLQSVLMDDWHNSDRLRMMWPYPWKELMTLVYCSLNSHHVRRWICPGRCCSVGIIFPEWFTAPCSLLAVGRYTEHIADATLPPSGLELSWIMPGTTSHDMMMISM